MKHHRSGRVVSAMFHWCCGVSLVLLLFQFAAVLGDELLGVLSTKPVRTPSLWLCLHFLMLASGLIFLRWPVLGLILLAGSASPFMARMGTTFFMPLYVVAVLPIVLLLWLWAKRLNSALDKGATEDSSEPKGGSPELTGPVWAKWLKRPVLPVTMLAVAAGCIGPVEPLYPPSAGEPCKRVYLVSHGLHTAVAMERADIPPGVWPANKDYAAFKYVEVGWGPDEIFQAPSLTVKLALKALFWPNRTVLLLDGFDDAPAQHSDPRGSVIEVQLSTPGFERLCDYVQKSHALDAREQPIGLGRNFYQARGTYWALNTCNNWTASAFRRAGCPITPTCCFTSGPLVFQARRFGRVLSYQGEAPAPHAY